MCSGNECWLFLLIPALPLFFVGLGLSLSFLLSKIGGWAELAEKYPVIDIMPQGEYFRMSSATLRKNIPVNYNTCLNITVTPEGLGMVPIWFFKMAHKPVFMPWADLEYSEGSTFRGKSAILAVRGTGITLTFWSNKLVMAIKERK